MPPSFAARAEKGNQGHELYRKSEASVNRTSYTTARSWLSDQWTGRCIGGKDLELRLRLKMGQCLPSLFFLPKNTKDGRSTARQESNFGALCHECLFDVLKSRMGSKDRRFKIILSRVKNLIP